MGGANSAWLTPILILTAAALLYVLSRGAIQQAAAMSASTSLPENFEYYSANQQMEYQQGTSMVAGPLFTFVLPGILSLLSLWVGWLVFGGLMHLALTLLGGCGAIGATIGMVARSSMC